MEQILSRNGGNLDPFDEAFEMVRGEAQVHFLDDWDTIKMLRCRDPLQEAQRLAHEHPLLPPRRGDSELYVKFVSLAGWLQVYNGIGRTILLPCRKVGDHLGVTRTTVSKLRRWALADNLLRVAKQDRFGVDDLTGELIRDATEFVFDLERFEVLVAHVGLRQR